MFELSTVRIPFNIRMAEGMFKGEAIGIGDGISPDCLFEIRLVNGEVFYLKAERDYELRSYNWTARATENLRRLFPILGRLIERHFSKNKASA